MAENAVTLVGSLTQDPVLRSGGRGDFTTFTLAVTTRYRDANGSWVDGQTSWFDVSADGALGRNAASSLAKGQRVVVHGTVGTRDVTKQDGSKTRYVQVRAEAVGLDLKFGTATFTKAAAARPIVEQAAPAQEAPPSVTAEAQRGGDWGGPPPEPERQTASAGWSSSLGADEDTPF